MLILWQPVHAAGLRDIRTTETEPSQRKYWQPHIHNSISFESLAMTSHPSTVLSAHDQRHVCRCRSAMFLVTLPGLWDYSGLCNTAHCPWQRPHLFGRNGYSHAVWCLLPQRYSQRSPYCCNAGRVRVDIICVVFELPLCVLVAREVFASCSSRIEHPKFQEEAMFRKTLKFPPLYFCRETHPHCVGHEGPRGSDRAERLVAATGHILRGRDDRLSSTC